MEKYVKTVLLKKRSKLSNSPEANEEEKRERADSFVREGTGRY